MKKILTAMIVCCFLFIALVSPTFAAWSVTATWTRSVGPGLASESVLVDGVSQCDVLPTDPTTCNFVLAALTGQSLVIRSFNGQGAYADTSPVILNEVPAPATGITVTITFVP